MFINKKPFLIAEVSANHCGSLDIAKKLILTAKKLRGSEIKKFNFKKFFFQCINQAN